MHMQTTIDVIEQS